MVNCDPRVILLVVQSKLKWRKVVGKMAWKSLRNREAVPKSSKTKGERWKVTETSRNCRPSAFAPANKRFNPA